MTESDPTSSSLSPIGLIGLGLLGSAIAERLLAAGYIVGGFDTSCERQKDLESLGGRAFSHAGDVFACHSQIILCLPNSQIVRGLIDAILPTISPGTLILDTTTGPPDDAVHFGLKLQQRGADYLDVTVSGSSDQMRMGEAVLMVGGMSENVTACQDVLAALGRQWFHVGDTGSGARMKLVTNLVLGLNRAALAEGLMLARRCHLDLEQTLEILAAGAAYSRVMDSKGEKMVNANYVPQAKLSQHLKDVRLIEELAQQCDVVLPLSAVHRELLEQAVRAGYGEADNSAVIEGFPLAWSIRDPG